MGSTSSSTLDLSGGTTVGGTVAGATFPTYFISGATGGAISSISNTGWNGRRLSLQAAAGVTFTIGGGSGAGSVQSSLQTVTPFNRVDCFYNGNFTTCANVGSSLAYTYSAPTTGSTVTIPDTQNEAILNPAGTLTSLTVKLPTCSAAFDGKGASFSTSQSITALTVTATAGAVNGAPASAAADTPYTWKCVGSQAAWFVGN